MSRAPQTLFATASMLALAVTARPITDPTVLNEMGARAQQAYSRTQQASLSLFQQLSSFRPPARDDNSPDPNSALSRVLLRQSSSRAIEHLVGIAGQAPMMLVEDFARANGHSVEDIPAVVHHTTSDETGEATIFVFAAPTADDPAMEAYPLAIAADSKTGDVVVASGAVDLSAEASATAETSSARPSPDSAPPSMIPPLIASCIAAFLLLGIIVVAVALVQTFRSMRDILPSDVESNSDESDGDITPRAPKSSVDAESAKMNELAEKVLSILESPEAHVRQPVTPRMVPLPAPTTDEEAAHLPVIAESVFVARERRISHLETEKLEESRPSVPMPEQDSVRVFQPSSPPVLPPQIALLFPMIDDGWILQFFVVLFGWWSVIFTGRTY